MASRCGAFILQALLVLAFAIISMSDATLSPNYYDKVCPKALPTIRRVVKDAVMKEKRMGASLLRLHFHDCFVNGCDASVLLDSTPAINSEKNSTGNRNSIRGFEVIDRIKSEVDKVCGRPVVSCADILTVAARDSVVELGGPSWKVLLGRRDSTTASADLANENLPLGSMNLTKLIENFEKQGLNVKDLVVLSGGHTLGFARCLTFRNRIHNETNINPRFANARKATCPRTGNGSNNLAPFDATANCFDTNYYTRLTQQKGLLHSDQVLFNGGQTDQLVKLYSKNTRAFWVDFAESMIKMGNIKPLTGKQGQIRLNCRRVN